MRILESNSVLRADILLNYHCANAVKSKNRLTLYFGCIDSLLKEGLCSNNNDDVVVSTAIN